MEQPPIRLGDLWPHQVQGYHFAKDKQAAMIAAGMGTGKTKLAIALLDNSDCSKVLVITPPSVRSVWRRELATHSATPIAAVILDSGTVSQRTETADRAMRSGYPTAVIINTEGAWRSPFRQWALRQRWDAVILDESHLGGIKTNGTRASEFVAQLTAISERRLTLSGTFLAYCPLDIFGQMRFLDPSIFGTDYKAFLQHFSAPRQMRLRKRLRKSHDALSLAVADCWGHDSPILDTMGDSPDYTDSLPGLKNAAEFAQRIAPVTWTCRTEDVLDLPPLITQIREVELGPEGRRVYDDLEQELYAAWTGGSCEINAVLTLAVRLKQITSGYLPGDNGQPCRIDTGKRDALHDLLREAAGEPVAVFCRYWPDLDCVQEVCRQLGLRYGEISGRRKDALTDLATLADGIDVAGVQPQSGGVGVDLTRAKIGVGYSFGRSPNGYDQAVARLHRPGTTGVRWYDLVCQNSIDADDHSGRCDLKQVIEGVLSRLKRKELVPCPV